MSFRLRKILCIMVIIQLLFIQGVHASSTADTISFVAGGVSTYHFGLTLLVPNPVTGISGGVWGCISFGAAIYHKVVDPPPKGPPVITSIVTGPVTGFDRSLGEFTASGSPVTQAPVGRIIALKGNNFSFTQNENIVMFNDKAVSISPLVSNTVLSTIVPPFEGPYPLTVEVRVVVGGVASAPFPFTVLPPESADGTEPVEEVLIDKPRELANGLRNFDWVAQLDAQAPNLTPDERASALEAARQMVRGAEVILARLTELETLLQTNTNVRVAAASLLKTNPEIGNLLDMAIGSLGNPQGPPTLSAVDTTPPTARITAYNPGPPAVVTVTVEDTGVGLRQVQVVHLENASAVPPFFLPGTKSIVVNATKQDQTKMARVDLAFVDVACNGGTGDPVFALVIRERGQPVTERFEQIPWAESKIKLYNGTPGISKAEILVNGTMFRITGLKSGQERMMDVSSSMLPGNHNLVEITIFGKPGASATLVIHD